MKSKRNKVPYKRVHPWLGKTCQSQVPSRLHVKWAFIANHRANKRQSCIVRVMSLVSYENVFCWQFSYFFIFRHHHYYIYSILIGWVVSNTFTFFNLGEGEVHLPVVLSLNTEHQVCVRHSPDGMKCVWCYHKLHFPSKCVYQSQLKNFKSSLCNPQLGFKQVCVPVAAWIT